MRRILPAVALLLLVGCIPILHRAQPSIAGDQLVQPSFCGIAKSLAGEKPRPARLLIIHGIGVHESYDYDKDLRDKLSTRLKLKLMDCSGPFTISNPDDLVNNYGSMRRCTYGINNQVLLRTYTLLWSPLTTPYKAGALQYDWEQPHHARRVIVNRILKRELIDQSFSDAVLYSGVLNNAMKYSVRQAFCAAITDETDLTKRCSKQPLLTLAKEDLFVITHSLGSMMFIETLREKLADEESRIAEELLRRVKLVSMMANQLPLINLSRISRPPDGSQSVDADDLARKMRASRGIGNPVMVAAFSDANDLLSYTIPDTWKTALFPKEADYFTFINYPVINARGAILGVFAYPATAHSGYWENSQVVAATADGYNCR